MGRKSPSSSPSRKDSWLATSSRPRVSAGNWPRTCTRNSRRVRKRSTTLRRAVITIRSPEEMNGGCSSEVKVEIGAHAAKGFLQKAFIHAEIDFFAHPFGVQHSGFAQHLEMMGHR